MPAAPVTVADCVALLDRLAPPDLHESWDNTGLLLGDPAAEVASITTCLTLTPDVAAEAIERGDGLIVTHHPIFFRPVQRLTANDAEGRTALDLVRAGVAVFSPHARWDNAAGGINERLARGFGLADLRPLRGRDELSAGDAEDASRGAGRVGTRKEQVSFGEFVQWIKAVMHLDGVDVVSTDRPVRSVGVACGSAGEYLSDAIAAGCDVFVTGEARFHAALQARNAGVGLVLVGHYASERFSMEELARELGEYFPDLPVRPSDVERDPLERL
ncbi:Nif3-like dinuclear metal center hexameric protein [Alienimonas sp. DA493]|uniref:Nif3-like dinuclear metal center hexameric protein n=1 Tax=Alienimonas sp. DA493 TaxID=3373605 RepID=UPI00375497A3